jgi:Ca-activated chloride channel family protein
MIAEFTALAVVAAVALAEWLHARRVRRVARLAFGPTGKPREWTWLAPFLRTFGAAALAWGLITLFLIDPKVAKPKKTPEGGFRHLVIVLDVSPSMQLKDAGPGGMQSRAKRAAEVLMSVLNRIVLEQCRVSVVAFYSSARPVVVECKDPEVVRNILGDLPLDQAFNVGKTRILEGLNEAVNLTRGWKRGSTTLILASDGDTVPETGMPALPQSIAQVLVVGVGDARLGKFIDGHQSRQDAATLRQIATRLRGVYHDGNEKHLPSQNSALGRRCDRHGKRPPRTGAGRGGRGRILLSGLACACAGDRNGRLACETQEKGRLRLNVAGIQKLRRPSPRWCDKLVLAKNEHETNEGEPLPMRSQVVGCSPKPLHSERGRDHTPPNPTSSAFSPHAFVHRPKDLAHQAPMSCGLHG